MPSEVSEYEAARLANIRKNNELLQSLGLAGAATLFDPLKDKPKPKPVVAKPKPKPKPVAVKKADNEDAEDDGDDAPGPSQLRRNASRTSTSTNVNYNLIELSRVQPKPLPPRRAPKKIKPAKPIKEKYIKPRIPGSRSSARLSKSEDTPNKYIEVSDSEDSSRDISLSPGFLLTKVQGPKLDPSEDVEGTGAYEEYERQPLPTLGPAGASGKGRIIFEDRWKAFTPNLTPQEMMEGGMFGGTAFRRHYSPVTKTWLEPNAEIEALPQEWFQNIDIASKLTRADYDPSLNRFGVKASQSLADWEQAGWVREWDPRGWWGWYIAFFLGRRCSDDARQISRWLKAVGPAGRFKRGLIKAVAASESKRYDDESIAPILRQTCWHWAVELTREDYEEALLV
ncbi:hypothetical protein CF326_g2558 [Tilletia indica]|nr:hypothetical protein CF326_g2558 [Tilletia indica]